jgi:hypothetical protein
MSHLPEMRTNGTAADAFFRMNTIIIATRIRGNGSPGTSGFARSNHESGQKRDVLQNREFRCNRHT